MIATPSASPAAGTYSSTQSVSLGSEGAPYICYSTTTTPTCDWNALSCSIGTRYSTALSIASTTTIQAVSCYQGGASSTVGSYTYTISIPSSGGGSGGGGGSISSPSTPLSTPSSTPSSQTTSSSSQQTSLSDQFNQISNLPTNVQKVVQIIASTYQPLTTQISIYGLIDPNFSTLNSQLQTSVSQFTQTLQNNPSKTTPLITQIQSFRNFQSQQTALLQSNSNIVSYTKNGNTYSLVSLQSSFPELASIEKRIDAVFLKKIENTADPAMIITQRNALVLLIKNVTLAKEQNDTQTLSFLQKNVGTFVRQLINTIQ